MLGKKGGKTKKAQKTRKNRSHLPNINETVPQRKRLKAELFCHNWNLLGGKPSDLRTLARSML
jgi:hypothetical protein